MCLCTSARIGIDRGCWVHALAVVALAMVGTGRFGLQEVEDCVKFIGIERVLTVFNSLGLDGLGFEY